MGPCTFLVTAAVTDKTVSVFQHAKNVWAREGIQGFYHGGTALIFRQGTNWASRQGFTDYIRGLLKKHVHGDSNAKLSLSEEALSGTIGKKMLFFFLLNSVGVSIIL